MPSMESSEGSRERKEIPTVSGRRGNYDPMNRARCAMLSTTTHLHHWCLVLCLLSVFAPHLAVAHAARIYFPSIPEDLYAFPKFRVSFLNGFPLLNETAHKWLTEGLQGGEDEFLGRDPHRDGHSSNLRKEISEHGNDPIIASLQDTGVRNVLLGSRSKW